MELVAKVFTIGFAGMMLHGAIFSSEAREEVWPWLVLISAANLLFVLVLVAP